MTKLTAILFVVALTFVSCKSEPKAEPWVNHEFSGVVKNEAGEVLPDIKVVIDVEDTNSKTNYTNSAGRYNFDYKLDYASYTYNLKFESTEDSETMYESQNLLFTVGTDNLIQDDKYAKYDGYKGTAVIVKDIVLKSVSAVSQN